MQLPDNFTFVELTPGDLGAVQAILRSNELPYEDCREHLPNFTGVREGGQLIAIGGFECCGKFALLRSVAVDSQYRGLKLGTSLVNKILDQLRHLEIEAVCILTETAEGYFRQHGFDTLEREMLPTEIQSTQQCQSLCPASAIAMRLGL